MLRKRSVRGFSLIEVIIVSAILLLFFAGLFTGVKLMLSLIGESKAENGARTLALARLESIRSLDYDSIGTVGGVPAGAVPQTSTTTLNGVEYTEDVLILYVDRAEDGLEGADENGVLEDSKRVRVEYSWTIKGNTKSLALVSDIAPVGQETSNGGGTLIAYVYDSNISPVEGAAVNVYNAGVSSSTINLSVNTNSEGKVIIPGMPAGGGYELSVTKSGYSADGTYDLTATNQNPDPPHTSVASSTITSLTFFIDTLADLTLKAVGQPVTYDWTDDMAGSSKFESMSSTTVSGGYLELSDNGVGGYVSAGTALSTSTAPGSFSSWASADWTATTATDTSIAIHVYTESGGSYSLVSDTDLAGNSAGFTSGPLDISGLSTTTYASLALGANLATTDSSLTPLIDSWQLTYIESEPPLANITFDLVGNKSIGKESDGFTEVPKYTGSWTTNSGGSINNPLEWDIYTVTLDGATEGYDIKEARGILPLSLDPSESMSLTLVLTSHTANSLHVTVVDSNGIAVSGADVTVNSVTKETSIYGQVFFDSLSATDYTVDISKTGYTNFSDTVTVSGNVMYSAALSS